MAIVIQFNLTASCKYDLRISHFLKILKNVKNKFSGLFCFALIKMLTIFRSK